MNRILDANNLVRLPNLSGTDAVALGTALETRARTNGLVSPSIEYARTELKGAHAHLQKVVEEQVYKEQTVRPLVEVDRDLDASWGAGYDVCKGWLRLPVASGKKDAARRIMDTLFAKGLTFTQIACRDQWVESQSRLDIIDEKGLGQDFVRIGAGEILDAIRAMHQEYGDVQGLTAAQDEEPALLREALDGFTAALRYYVLQVVAHARPDDPASEERSRDLLAPLTSWQSRRRQESGGSETPDEVVPGAEPGAEPDEELEPGAQADDELETGAQTV